jgi:YHS domain-containing protein
VKVYGDQEVKFCCQACVAEFEANQDAYLAKLESKAQE